MYKEPFNFYFNKQKSSDFSFSIVKRYNPPAPKKRFKEYEIAGRDGKLYEDIGTYEDIEIAVDCNFIIRKFPFYQEGNVNQQIDWITNWLNYIKDNRLRFSDMSDYYYKVNKVEITNLTIVLKQLCRFTLVFNCKPFKYLQSGEYLRELHNNEEMRNQFPMASKPIYEITGNGLCEITRNGKKVSIEVSGKAYIDTELGLCYTESNEYINSKMTGYYENLYYETGENLYSWTNGFTIKFKTNAIRL